MKQIQVEFLKKQLRANAEVNKKAAYYLLNHVVRDDNQLIQESAKKVAALLQKCATRYIKKIEKLEQAENTTKDQ